MEWYNIIERRIYVDYSPGNLVFGTDVVVSTSDIGSGASIPAQPSRGVYAGPSIDTDRSGGVHDGRLYTVYADIGPGGLPDVDVYVRYSDDQAATWSPRSLVNDDGGTSSQFLPILAVDQVLGIVGVSFYDTRNDPSNGRAEMRVAASYDGGVTFAENLTLSSGPSDQSAGNPSAWIGNYLDCIGLAIHNGVASGVWSDNSTDPADLDLFFGRVSLLDPASTPEEEGFATGPVRDGDHESRLSGASVSPNPVSDQTQLSFDLAIPMRVRVGVFDVSGRAVRVLVDEERPAGRQSVVWDRRDAQGRDASPGTYFYRIEVPGQQLQGKVIVVG